MLETLLGIKRVRWEKYGVMLRPSPFKSTSLATRPTWEITFISDPESVASRCNIVIIANLMGKNIPFATLRKTAVADSKEIGAAFISCIDGAMYKMQTLIPDIFPDKEELKIRTMQKYSCHVARAIGRLIRFSNVRFLNVLVCQN